ncbi:hypothetical protein TVAG_608070 [Trichomonas vaginalis G3]|uniref:Uncharacterized protein n=3 Tax=Trichomonas vaginalis (strain ATCC PRA-98 / G3) TaxID=412133 RepID=A2GL69_TRIV3|nr:hypothetical protein TVAGG3_0803840 [Trichomonas vaginalis G3]EAX82098.1 hypothetical protein TVAG_608070 [Trichomonas vaginalis G3]KAI5496708.1 hypothetical protein TVAGG3_0803840 [Trichomonas vaginalis G3]|eukprot:XP_001295028.1 hypothetical protein [Trichomonas vaginalis G3]
MGHGVIPSSEFDNSSYIQAVRIIPPRSPSKDEKFYFVILTMINEYNSIYEFTGHEEQTIARESYATNDLEYFLISLNSSIKAIFITGFYPLPLVSVTNIIFSETRQINFVLIPNYDTTYHILVSSKNRTVTYYTNSTAPNILEPESNIFIRENTYCIISFEIEYNSHMFEFTIDSMELHNDFLRDQDYFYGARESNTQISSYFTSLLNFERYSPISLGIIPTNNASDVCIYVHCAFLPNPYMDGHVFAYDSSSKELNLSKGYSNISFTINSTRYPSILFYSNDEEIDYVVSSLRDITINLSKSDFYLRFMVFNGLSYQISSKNYKINIMSNTAFQTLRANINDTSINGFIKFKTTDLYKKPFLNDYIKFDNKYDFKDRISGIFFPLMIGFILLGYLLAMLTAFRNKILL